MDPKDKKTQYGLENATDVPASHEDYSLEEILAEFGGSLEQMLLKGAKTPPEEDARYPPKRGPCRRRGSRPNRNQSLLPRRRKRPRQRSPPCRRRKPRRRRSPDWRTFWQTPP